MTAAPPSSWPPTTRKSSIRCASGSSPSRRASLCGTSKEGNTAMKISTLGRHLREGGKSVIRNGWMSFASASSIAISLFILGVFLLLGMNLNDWTKEVENQVEIRVYLSLDATESQVATLHQAIGNLEEVRLIRFVPKEEGLELLRESLGSEADKILDGFEDDNPLPDAFTIEVDEPRQIGVAADKIEALNDRFALPLIDKV